jgi:hypothetical protein
MSSSDVKLVEEMLNSPRHSVDFRPSKPGNESFTWGDSGTGGSGSPDVKRLARTS